MLRLEANGKVPIANSTHVVYHASPVQGLTEISVPASPPTGEPGFTPPAISLWPRSSSGRASAATSPGGVGTFGGIPYVVERFAGALNARYLGISGSIYTLSADDFEAGSYHMVARPSLRSRRPTDK